MRRAVMALAAMAACSARLACTPLPPLAPVPVQYDAGRDACAVDDEITAARLIRTPDGAPLVVRCE